MRIHLQRAALSGVVDPLLEFEPLPRCTAILWQVFLELNATRSSGMGANPLSLLEIDAWCNLSAVQLTAWEFATIKAIDSAVLSEWSKSKQTEPTK